MVGRLTRQLISCLDALAAAVFIFAFAVQLAALVMRDIFSIGLAEQTDIGSLSIVILCFFGMIRAFETDLHVKFDLLEKKVGGRLKSLIVLLSKLISAIALAVFGYLSALAALQYMHLYLRTLSMPWLPYWPFMACISFGCVISILAIGRSLSNRK